jgi:1-acyl-sn-glycerol-3-phosphate acyltransferase
MAVSEKSTFNNILYKLIALIIRTILRINGGVEVRGKENVPSEGGVLMAANHISYLDPPLVGSVSPRRATFMARQGLFDVPVLGRMIRSTAFPVDREKTRPSTIKETVRRLKGGELIVIFPEGKRSETGQFMEAKRGIGMIAGLSKVPVVPTLIVGADKALPVNARFLKRAKITVIFGKPIYYSSFTEDKTDRTHKLHEELSSKIMDSLKEMQSSYGH